LITLKQLEAFYWSDELGSFDAAAVRLNTTQSTISKRVQELESALEVMLFDRSRRRAQLTARGEELRALAAEMLALRTRIIDISRAQPVAPRTLRIGVTELTALTWLPGLVQRIRGAYPHVTLEPVVDTSVTLTRKLKEGELDVVVTPDAFRASQLEIVPLDSVEYAWLCSPDYLPDGEALTLPQLAQYTIIEQANASGLGNLLSQWLLAHNVKLESKLASSNLTAAASLTISGVGICYLPRRIFDDTIAAGKLRAVRSTPAIPRIPYVLMFERARSDDFVRYVASVATDTCDFTRMSPSYF